MTINFLGDSITKGVGASCEEKIYVNQVKKALDCNVNNYGVSGTRIAKNRAVDDYYEDFQIRAEKMTPDADYVFIFGGTNDFGHGDAPLGNNQDTDPYTFYGGLKNLINILLNKYSKEKLVFMLPLRRWNENVLTGSRKAHPVATLETYVNVMKEVLDSYELPYIDFFHHGTIDTPPFNTEPSAFFKDGLHPNDLGHSVIAQAVVAYVQRLEYER